LSPLAVTIARWIHGEDRPKTIVFDDLGIRIDVVLRKDRIALKASSFPEVPELPLDIPDNDE
jgi:hypothetical protein